MIHKMIILVFLFYAGLKGKAQITLNDASWQVVKLDDFDSLNTSDWNTGYTWTSGLGIEYTDPANVIFQSGWLKLKCEKLTTPHYIGGFPFYYRSAALQSKFTYKYGYFEVEAKFPVGLGYWPAFWTLGGATIASCPTDGEYNEIDITETLGYPSSLGTQTGQAVHWRNFTTCLRDYSAVDVPVSGGINISHKYAVFWEPSKVSFYIDDVLVNTFSDSVYTPHNLCGSLLDLAIEGGANAPNSSTTFPAYAEFNYVKISQLTPGCSTAASFCSTEFNAGTYDYKVKQSITIGGSGCASPSTINTSSNIVLWATDFILLDEGTTINDNGSGSFTMNITECPN
jgi:beta-glucanase (GH16 family)